MAKLTVTENLGSCLKNLRIKYNIKAIDVSKYINKSGAYITKLEKAEIKSIDMDELLKILAFITQNNDDDDVNKVIEKILNECNLQYSKEEAEEEEWMMNFDTVVREIPIPIALKDFLNHKLNELSLSTDELSNYINSNFDLYDDNNVFLYGDISNQPRNLWIFNNGKSYIIMHLEKKTIDSILSGERDCCNYVTMQSIVLTIFKKMNYSVDEAYKETYNKLNEFKFYSLTQKKRILSAHDAEKDITKYLNEFETNNLTIINNIIHHIKFFSDINLKYTNSKLEKLNKNFEIDPSLTMAFLGIDISKLKKIDVETKREFIKEVNNLINEYSIKTSEEEKITLI